MKSTRRMKTLVPAALLAGCLGVALTAAGQDASPKGTDKYGYHIRQSVDLGGHIAENSGSRAVYDNLVDLQTGPRILNQTLDMHALDGTKHLFFDTLFTASSGYGGDPDNYSTLRISKGKLYDFSGMFRRDRQHFDYDLFSNPLIPTGVVSNGYTFPQINDAPHLFNTVRRMTDTTLTLFPVSKLSFRAGYARNIMEGPTYSSIHLGADALLLQNWRNSTDTWLGAVDFKPWKGTVLTYEEHINHYKGDTSWQLAGLNMQLANGTPVTIGFDNVGGVGATSASSGCGAHPAVLNAATNPPTANPCVNGYLSYSRSQPTRALFPTEEFRFQSTGIRNFQTNGRILYSGASMTLPGFNENFSGLESRVTTPVATVPPGPAPSSYCTRATNATTGVVTYSDCHRTSAITGFNKAQRINVSADYGFAWTINDQLTLVEQYDFQNWRQPAVSNLTEVDGYGTSMLAAPREFTPADNIVANNFLGQKTHNNRLIAEYAATSRVSVSVGFRYRDRNLGFVQSLPTDFLANGRNYTYNDRQMAFILGSVMRPTSTLKLNGELEIGRSSTVYIPTDAKNFENYKVRGTWKPKSWATLSGGFIDHERKDNQVNVGYLAHNRVGSAAATLTPSEHYSFDFSYGYIDVFSRIQNCFDDATFVPSDATPIPVGVTCGNAVNTATSTVAYYGTSYYDAPTQYGSFGILYSPITKLRTGVGYRMSAADGKTEFLNPRNAPGALQSEYQTPYASVGYTVAAGWGFSGNWNYYGYGEGSPIGPTLPRSFRGNVYTLGMHYEF